MDADRKVVTVRTPDGEVELTYDALVLAPGARAVVPPIPGIDSPRVRTLRTR
ncbi:FAD-dependent oxidoreductase [Propioniciclava flava]